MGTTSRAIGRNNSLGRVGRAGLAIGLIGATLTVWHQSANAASGDPDTIAGVIFNDINGSGTMGDNDPATTGAAVEAPLAGVEVTLSSGGLAVATQTTDTSGVYDFGGLAPGDYTVTASFPATHQPVATGADSPFAPGGAPAPGDPYISTYSGSLDGTTGIVADAGGMPRAILTLDLVDLDPGPGVLPAVETGTPSFNTTGDCATDTSSPTPGDDCGSTDDVVRTNDLVTTTYAVAADNIPDPGIDPLTNVIFEQIITPTGGATVTYDSIPGACALSGVTPPTSITVNPDGTTTLLCNLGNYGNELKIVSTTMKPSGTSPNGSGFTTTERVYQANDDAIPVVRIPGIDINVSAAPRFDITMGTSPENPFNRLIRASATAYHTNPTTGETEGGVSHYFDVSALYTGGVKGQSALDDPITFSFNPDPTYPSWHIVGCPNEAYPGGSLPTGGSPATSLGSEGNWTCTADRASNQINVTVSGVDVDGDPVPSEGDNGTDLSAGPYVAFAGRIQVWIPFSDFYKSADPSWQTGDAPLTGDYAMETSVTDFNPVSATGVANFAGVGEPTTNQSRTTNVAIYDKGSFSQHYGNIDWLRSARTGRSSAWPCYGSYIAQGSLVDGQTGACGAGDGPIQAGQEWYSWSQLVNTGAIDWSADTYNLCHALDNSTYRLTEIDATRGVSYIASSYGAVEADWVVEYATGGTTAGTKTWGTDPITNDFAALGEGAENCGTGNADWSTDPYSFDADPDLSLGKITFVRIRPAAHITTLSPGQGVQFQMGLVTRDTFFGGPNDGESIPAGIYLPLSANRSYGSQSLRTVASGSLYQVEPVDNTSYGDRVIYSKFQIRIDKRTSGLEVGDDLVDQVVAGEPVMWSLHPAVTAVTDGGVAENVQIVDVLPQFVTLDRACQAAQPLPPGVSLTSVTPGPGTGETTLVFDLGDRGTNEPIGVIPICTVTDAFAPPATDVTNKVTIDADDDVSPADSKQDERTVKIVQTGSFAISKSVDSPIELQNDTQEWTIGWVNLSTALPFAAPDVIDVLPYNGDFENTNNGRSEFDSEFESRIALLAPVVAPTTRRPDGTESPTAGTWYYTSEPSADVSHNPRDASNDLTTGSTKWCTEVELGNAVAPCDFGITEATALRFVSDDALQPEATALVSFVTGAGTSIPGVSVINDPRDRYVNRFAAFSSTFPNQLIRSNEVLVQVLSLSVGDLVFLDADLDGTFDPAIDSPISDVDVELYDSTGSLVGTTTTDDDGRYIFQELLNDHYEVRIPADQFVPGAPLEGLLATVVNGAPDDDRNESVDQHATMLADGSASSGLIELVADTSDDPPIGLEPTGEDVADIEDPLTYDNFSNLSLDLGFAGDPGVALSKQTCVLDDTRRCDVEDNSHWGEINAVPDQIPYDVVWRIQIFNSGNQVLTNIEVADPLVPSCDATAATQPGLASILPGATYAYSCTASDLAKSLTNTATVTAENPGGAEVTDTDPAGSQPPVADPDLEVIKYVAGQDANAAPGVGFTPGDAVVWTYAVTNTGNVAFTTVELSDDAGTVSTADDLVPTYVDGDDGDTVLSPGETWNYTLSGTAVSGAYENVVTADGTGVWDGESFESSDDDPANLFGAEPAVTLVKYVDGNDADTVPGPGYTPGETVNFTYVVENTGNTILVNLAVTDDQGVVVSCPDDELAPGESMTCTGSATAIAGAYVNIGTVTGTPAAPNDAGDTTPLLDTSGTALPDVTDSNPANYHGGSSAIDIVKFVEALDADEAPGPALNPGDPVRFTYDVTNTGSTALTDVSVVDDQGVAVSCPTTTLLTGESMTCTGEATVTDGAYVNIGTATGVPSAPAPDGTLVPIVNSDGTRPEQPTAENPANHFGAVPAIDIVKYAQNDDANEAPGVYVPTDSIAEFLYVVTNSGNTALSELVVVDDQGVVVTCPVTVLAPGASTTCTGSTTVVDGDYTNIGTATAQPSAILPDGSVMPLVDAAGTPLALISDDDPANLFGSRPEVSIVKYVADEDANEAPGVGYLSGELADFTYEVENSGNTWLRLDLTDDQGVEIVCPVAELAPGEATVCTGQGAIPAGPYINIGSVSATPIEGPGGDPIEVTETDGTREPFEPLVDEDPANAFGIDPSIQVSKTPCYRGTCGSQIRVPDDGLVEWKITVTNVGNVDLDNVVAHDDRLPECDRTIGSLAIGATESWSCSALASVTRENSVAVTATPVLPGGTLTPSVQIPATVSSSDASRVLSPTPRISTVLAFTGSGLSRYLIAAGFGLVLAGAWFMLIGRRKRVEA